MLTPEDYEKIEGFQYIKYANSDQDKIWRFAIRVISELKAENDRLNELIREKNDESSGWIERKRTPTNRE